MSDFIGPPAPSIIAADEEWYRERSRGIWRVIDERTAPHPARPAIIPASTCGCSHCFGSGIYQDETCPWCEGCGSQATLNIAADHFERIQRTIINLAAE